ncbi:MAG TPA: hypothetical protein P5215_03615 [Bacteroidales bacterium]|nr:hypothetical protein [Bacteroidales bacterium]
MPPRCARGRSTVPSPRAEAVGTQGGKKSLQARFFAAASPAASALAGFPPPPSHKKTTPSLRTLFTQKGKTKPFFTLNFTINDSFFLLFCRCYLSKKSFLTKISI